MSSVELGDLLAGERIDDRDAFDLVAEELDARDRLFVRGMELDRVAPHPELASAQRHVVAFVLHVDELAQDRPLVALLAHVGDEELALVLRGVAHAVDARDRRHDDDIASSEQRRGRRVAEAIDLVVDRAVLLDVGVARRDVRLGLVVVVVRRRSTRLGSSGRTRGTRSRAARRATCWVRARASVVAPSRSSTRSWRSCRCR